MKGEQKNMADVYHLTKLALENDLKFKWYNKQPTQMGYSGSIEINKQMTPSQMYRQIALKLRAKGIEVNEQNFYDLQAFIEKNRPMTEEELFNHMNKINNK